MDLALHVRRKHCAWNFSLFNQIWEVLMNSLLLFQKIWLEQFSFPYLPNRWLGPERPESNKKLLQDVTLLVRICFLVSFLSNRCLATKKWQL